jgi:Conserved TM helix
MVFTGAVEIGDSLQRGLDEFVAFLPRLAGFLIILLVGWLIARAIKALLVTALQRVGIDRALTGGPAGAHVDRVLPDARPSEIIGTIGFWFVFLGVFAIAAGVSGLVSRMLGDTATGRIAAAAAPVLIMGIAIFMILDQLDIAPAIVEITYVALVGSVALGMAIAFGLGGRDVAARLLEDAYESGRGERDAIRRRRAGPTATARHDPALKQPTAKT